jgi:huntingtin
MGTASYKTATEETKTLFLRASSLVPPSRSIEGASSLLSQFTTKDKKMLNKSQRPISGGPLTVALSMLKSSVSLDLQAHQDILLLCAKLLHGCGVQALLSSGTKAVSKIEETDLQWIGLKDRHLVPLIEQIITHVFRLLNVLCHVMEDKEPRPPETKIRDRLLSSSVPSTGPATSPRKKGKASEKDNKTSQSDGEKEKTGKTIKSKDIETESTTREKAPVGSFYQMPYYTSLYESLKGSFGNYKVTVDTSVPEKFGSMLKTTLKALALILELACVEDIGKYTGEVINYMCITVQFCPSETYFCVEQLLNALFGANPAAQPGAIPAHLYSPYQPNITSFSPSIYDVCIIQPSVWLKNQVVDIQTTARDFDTMPSEGKPNASFLKWMKSRRRKSVWAFVGRPDVGPIVKYIEAFEPLVIRSLRQYTGTGDADLQRQILQLLIQLIRLRVNYSMLDAEQAFLKYVVSQVEHIEDGYVRDSSSLIPYIFRFLVLLSYERSQPSIINVPRLIQLCDGVMAVGVAAEDYTIPSLRPVVYDLFVARNSSSMEPDKRLETQREVVISILNRIVQHQEVLSMLVIVLQASQISLDKWITQSKMILSNLVPRLRQQQVHLYVLSCQKLILLSQVELESHSALATLHLLFTSLATCTLCPISQFVDLLLKKPLNRESKGLARWLSGVLASLRVITAVCSESELLREIANADAESWLSDVCPWLGCCPYSDSCDVFAWKLFGLMNFLVTAIQSHCLPYQHIGVLEEFLCELILQFILMVHLVLETFPAVLAASKRICQRLEDMTKDLTAKFLLLISCQPFLVTSWCHLLSLIEYQSEWWDYLSVKLVTLPNPPTESTMKACSSSEEQQYRPTQTQDLLLDPLISVSEPLNMRWKLVKDVALAMQSEQLIKLGVQDSIANFIQLTACDLARLQNERAVVELLKTVQGSGQLSDVFVKCLCTKLSTSLPLNLKKKMIVSFLFVHPSCIATVLHFLLGTVRCCALMPFVETVCTSLVERLTELHHQDGPPYFSQDEVVELEKTVLAAVRPSVKFKKLLKLLNYQVVQLQNESIDSAHFLAAGSQRHIEPTTDLKKFTQYVSAMCINSQSAPSTCHAQLLHCLSHNTILKILRHEQFDIRLLKFCISLGAQDTIRLLAKQGSFEEYDLEMEHIGLDTSEYFDEHGIDHLLDASRTVMFERIEQLLSQRNHCTPDSGATSVVPDQLSDNSQLSIVPLASALSKYLDYVSDIPKADIPHDGTEWLPAVLLDCLKHAFWLWQKIPSEDIISLLKCSAKILKNRRVYSMLCKSQRSQWCYNFVNILFEFVQLLLLGSQTASIQTVQTHEVPYTSTKEMATDSTTQVHSRICSLVHWLNETQCLKSVPQSVSRPLQSLVINLARLPALELHARTPASLVGRINAIGDSSGRVRGASISSEDLRDEDVLIDYVARVLTLGWRNRQQFEVTWVTLQGLLSPPAPLDELPDEETVEVYKVTCVAVKAITSLLVQTLLAPTPGHPAGSQLLHTCRQKELPFLGSRAGKKLLALCSIIELSTPSTCESTLPIFRSNTERPLNTCEYGSGQLNVTSLQVRVVTSDVRSVEDQPDDESNSVFSMHPHEVVETVDVKSCLQLLLELYAQWLDTSVSPRPPIMLIFEIMKSAVILSDVFEEFWHFQWLLEHCLRLAATNMSEDEQILQYLILGACKASAVLRNEQYTERVAKLALLGLSASQEAAQVLTLHGVLYILEAHAGADMKVLLPSLSDHVISLLLQTACGEVQICHEYQMTLWSTAFFLVEQYSDDLKITDFSARVVKVALVFLSAGDVAPLPVYLAVIHCLERLLLSFTLSKSDREAVSKVALERYDSLTAKRSLPALGLLLTYLYTGKSGDQASGISQLEKETLNDPGMEDQVAVLEKLTRILDRMHKALPAEAAVVARVLPSLLQDFMPRYQIMTKVVGEFLSSQQPYPGLMAEVMFKVFENLIQKNELEFVTEWVLLSLGSVIQRTPLGMAIWSLNCLFVCSSLNGPIRAQYPQFSV